MKRKYTYKRLSRVVRVDRENYRPMFQLITPGQGPRYFTTERSAEAYAILKGFSLERK